MENDGVNLILNSFKQLFGDFIMEKKKKEYLETGGVKCLFCKSTNIEGGFLQVDASYSWQKMTCFECGKKWRDIYTLTDVEVEE